MTPSRTTHDAGLLLLLLYTALAVGSLDLWVFSMDKGLLSSPHLHVQDGLLFALPVALGYAALREDPRAGRAFGSFALACPLLFLLGELLIGDRLGIRVSTLLMGALAVWLTRSLKRKAQESHLPQRYEMENVKRKT